MNSFSKSHWPKAGTIPVEVTRVENKFDKKNKYWIMRIIKKSPGKVSEVS